MSSDSEHSVHQLQHDFQDLVEYVTSEESQSRTAYEVELTLFKRLLALGAQFLRLFFVHGPRSVPVNLSMRRTRHV